MALSGSMHVCYFSMHKLFYDTGGQHSICATISYLYRRNGVRGQLSYRTSYAKHTLHMHHRNRKISSVKCMVARYQLLFTGVCSRAPRCPSSISSCCLYLEIQIFPFSRQSLGSLQSVMKFQHPSIRAVPPPLLPACSYCHAADELSRAEQCPYCHAADELLRVCDILNYS